MQWKKERYCKPEESEQVPHCSYTSTSVLSMCGREDVPKNLSPVLTAAIAMPKR